VSRGGGGENGVEGEGGILMIVFLFFTSIEMCSRVCNIRREAGGGRGGVLNREPRERDR